MLEIISQGYKIPFFEIPQPSSFKNNKSAGDNSEFVSSSIQELIRTKRVVEAPFIPKVVSPLSVSSNKGKKRLILDLRYVNKHVWKDKVKFEDWKIFQRYLKKDGYVFTFDLKSGYHHVDIYPPHQTYLGFAWTENGVTKYFCFTVLPFGLTSSPFIFTKLLRPLVKYWRLKGLLVVMYIDDGICISTGLNRTTRNAKFVRDTLKRAGLVANAEKCSWDPTHFAEWLGINVDTHKGILYLPTMRIESLTSSIDKILTSLVHSSARKLSQVTGKIISMQPVLGDISRLMTRHFTWP